MTQMSGLKCSTITPSNPTRPDKTAEHMNPLKSDAELFTLPCEFVHENPFAGIRDSLASHLQSRTDQIQSDAINEATTSRSNDILHGMTPPDLLDHLLQTHEPNSWYSFGDQTTMGTHAESWASSR